jgi:hypothetical protein
VSGCFCDRFAEEICRNAEIRRFGSFARDVVRFFDTLGHVECWVRDSESVSTVELVDSIVVVWEERACSTSLIRSSTI